MGRYFFLGGVVALWGCFFGHAVSQSYAEDLKTYRLKAEIIQCLPEDPMFDDPLFEGFLEQQSLKEHPACGNLKARTLAHVDLPLQHQRTKIWNNLKNVTIVGKAYDYTFEAGKGFVFSATDKPAESIKIGVEVKAHLEVTDPKNLMLSLLVKHYSVDEAAEEMILTSDGKTYLNPYPREVVRMVRVHVPVIPNKEDIWGGEGVFQGVAPVRIPHFFPENARLWVSGKIEK